MKTVLLAITVLLGLGDWAMAGNLSFDLLGMDSPAILAASVDVAEEAAPQAEAKGQLGYEEARQLAMDTQRDLVICRGVHAVDLVKESSKYVVAVVGDDDGKWPMGISYYRLTFVFDHHDNLVMESSPDVVVGATEQQQMICTPDGCFPADFSKVMSSQPMSFGSSCANGSCSPRARWRSR